MHKVIRIIDSISEWAGKVGAWFLVPLVFITFIEVVMRYVFNAPTRWAWDVNVQLQAALVALGGSYALLHQGHVSLDIVMERVPIKTRRLVELLTGLLVILAIALLLWALARNTWFSITIQEHWTSPWRPPIYPLKTFLTMGVGILLLQAIGGWIRNLMITIHGPAGFEK